MKLFLFLAASVIGQENCHKACEEQHVNDLAQCDHDHTCINDANGAFRECTKACDNDHGHPPCEDHCYHAHEQQLGHCKEDDQACIDRANEQLDYCLGHCEHGPGGEHGPQYNMKNCEERCKAKAQEGAKENCEGKDDTECINKFKRMAKKCIEEKCN